ncbi:hypothetical protein GCM10023214_20740 [Amycolatopsis dongchuanensis]|uniref:N-acetyltransferase domain-containing protein n=1 Tax=Amycolatopsis dongchuanensis TaxID=1070866 RepID=A0ABP9Q9N5_9PSEU
MLAGMASGLRLPDDVVEVRSVWVSPHARGHRVGDRLLEAVEQWARGQGAVAVRLFVLAGNERAIALYRRHGFVAAGESGAELRMRKTLRFPA